MWCKHKATVSHAFLLRLELNAIHFLRIMGLDLQLMLHDDVAAFFEQHGAVIWRVPKRFRQKHVDPFPVVLVDD